MIKVAMAEDDFRVAAIHEQFLLTIEGVKIAGKALNGKETLSLLDNNKIDLLLLDIYMPDTLGTDLLKIIREKYPSVDVIMITAAVEKDIVEQSLRNGVYDYIIKPVSIERFKKTIMSYKKQHHIFKNHREINQVIIDELTGYSKGWTNLNQAIPKGIDPLTLKKVTQIMRMSNNGISAEELGCKLGASRTTARRYLEYLISTGDVRAELEYGLVGRPERKYRTLRIP